MGPFGAGIRWEAGRQDKKTVFSQRAQGTQGKHEGFTFIFAILALSARGYF